MTKYVRRDIYEREGLYETMHYAAHRHFIQNTAWVREQSDEGGVVDRLYDKGTASRAICVVVGVVDGTCSHLAPHGDFDVMDGLLTSADRSALQHASRCLTLVAPPAHMFTNFHRDFIKSCDQLKLLVDVLDADDASNQTDLKPERDWAQLKMSRAIFDDKDYPPYLYVAPISYPIRADLRNAMKELLDDGYNIKQFDVYDAASRVPEGDIEAAMANSLVKVQFTMKRSDNLGVHIEMLEASILKHDVYSQN